MKKEIFNIIKNNKIAKNVYEIRLEGNTDEIKTSGQFVNILIDNLYLRRPISVCDYNKKELILIYKVVGKGTEKLSKMKSGKLDVLVGLGNGYDLTKSGYSPLLIGGGVGIPPLYNLCKKLLAEGNHVSVLLGFNSSDEVFYEKEFNDLGAKVYVCTVDGSKGIKGFVTDVMKNLKYSYFYTCGPELMLKAIDKIAITSGQFSFEEKMGCGFGACMGCTCKTKYGNKRICKDGPVLEREEIIW